jgi:hypothetical protein
VRDDFGSFCDASDHWSTVGELIEPNNRRDKSTGPVIGWTTHASPECVLFFNVRSQSMNARIDLLT